MLVRFPRCLVLIVGLLFAASAACQNRHLDSLQRACANATDPILKYRSAYYCAKALVQFNSDKALLYADSANILALSVEKTEWLSKTYHLKGLIMLAKNNLSHALDLFEQAREQAVLHNDHENEGLALVGKAAVYVDMGDMNKALEEYKGFQAKHFPDTSVAMRQAKVKVQTGLGLVLKSLNRLAEAVEATKLGLDMANRFGLKNEIWNFYDNLGLLYGRMGDYKAKLNYHRLAIRYGQRDDPWLSAAYNNLGNAYLMMNLLDSAALCFEKVLNNPKTKWKNLIHTYNGLSQVCFNKGNYKDSYGFAQKSLPLALKTGNAMTLVLTKTRLAKALMGLKRYREAIDTFRSLLPIMDTNKDFAFTEERASAKNYLAQAIALEKGLPTLADLIHEYKNGRDSIHNFIVTNSIESMRIQFETRQKEDSIKLWQANTQVEAEQKQIYRMGLLGSGFILFLLSGFFYSWKQKQNLENTMLEQQNEQLTRENHALLVQKQDIEQNSKSIHDFADAIVVLNGNDKVTFRIGEILYIESQGNGIQVVTLSGKYWRWQTIKNMEATLPNPPFIKVHRSYLINGMHIKQFKASQLTLSNGNSVPIGGTLQTNVQAFIRKWLKDL